MKRTIDCPACTSGGIIQRQKCYTCGECRWVEGPSVSGRYHDVEFTGILLDSWWERGGRTHYYVVVLDKPIVVFGEKRQIVTFSLSDHNDIQFDEEEV